MEKQGIAHEVIVMPSATPALDYMRNNMNSIPELIFLDINMPQMNGFEFLEEYDKLGITSKCSIVMLSSSVHPDDQQQAQNPCVRMFLSKPLTPDKLKEVLEMI